MDLSIKNKRLAFLTIFNGLSVLLVGLVAGLGLTFSLLEAVALWPFPAWEVTLPGSVRGWQAAHVGGILNGVMIAVSGLLMIKLELRETKSFLVGWGMIITGWANTVFYWAGNFSSNRGLSVSDTVFGEGDLLGSVAYLIGLAGMIFTFIAITILVVQSYQKVKSYRKKNIALE